MATMHLGPLQCCTIWQQFLSGRWKASALKPIVPSTSPPRKNARAETDSRTKTMAKTQVRKASAAHHRKHFAQSRRPANTRIAASDQPARAFFSLSILQ